MNALKLISAAAILAATVMTSCNSDDDVITGNDRPVEVRFSANTAEIQTRVTETGWAADDPVGIYMIKADEGLATESIIEEADNREYRAAAAGAGAVAFTAAGSKIYYPVSGNVEFIAYYPYASTGITAGFKLPVNVLDQGDQSAIDVLYAPKTNGSYNKSTTSPVALAFTHKLVKLVFSISALSEYGVTESLDGLAVKITGQKTEATLDLTNGTVTPSGEANQTITANTAAGGASSEAIVLPNDGVAGMTFTFTTAAGGVYEVAVPAPVTTNDKWEAGYKYAYTVTLKRNEAGISGTASGWDDGGNYNVTGTPQKEFIVETVLIPAGTFFMGSPDTEPDRESEETRHEVTLTKDYYMSKYPVTNARYADFLNDVGVDNSGAKAGIQDGKILIEADAWGVRYNVGQWEPATSYENHPVIYVSWYGAKAYAEWAGGDLPTEAQWERAARGGINDKPYGIGDGTALTSTMANFGGDVGHTTAVGAYPYANDYGLYDMHGNVYEWCLDQWDFSDYADLPAIDPVCTSGSNRVLRGGDWGSGARNCRSAYRNASSPDYRGISVGFRVVFCP